MGLRTVRGEAREGFFIPYRYAGAVPDIVAPYDAQSPLFEAQRAAMSTWLNKAEFIIYSLDTPFQMVPFFINTYVKYIDICLQGT